MVKCQFEIAQAPINQTKISQNVCLFIFIFKFFKFLQGFNRLFKRFGKIRFCVIIETQVAVYKRKTGFIGKFLSKLLGLFVKIKCPLKIIITYVPGKLNQKINFFSCIRILKFFQSGFKLLNGFAHYKYFLLKVYE